MDHMTFWKLTCFLVPYKLHAIQHTVPTPQVVCECLLATEFSSQAHSENDTDHLLANKQ